MVKRKIDSGRRKRNYTEGGEGEEMMSGDGEVDDNDETIGSGGDDNVRLEVNEEEEERKEKEKNECVRRDVHN
ncbi:hypothetical protein F2Q70_00013791 [Brassica cretica]|uniref:Uncharacterized protein n=1 Tax=Brassica cretica TaxID=69181 RepID=A0A8S9M0Z3_BRACR|nr:hypothetical protein F2Q70_00013791 [Brassica cretica]